MWNRVRRSTLSWMRDRRGGSAGARPVVLSLLVTDNCNARCVMCDVWKTRSLGEMDATDLSRVLADRLFSDVQHVGISGGEPSLRADLPELVDSVVSTIPTVTSLSITSHGFHHERWSRFLPEIMASCRSRGIRFTLNLSVDGNGPVHDAIRGIPGAFGRTMRTHELAGLLGANVVWQSTVCATNVFAVGDILHLARARGVGVTFREATEIARLDNTASVKSVALDDGGRSFFADFVRSDAAAGVTTSPARKLFYGDLARQMVEGSTRQAPCHFQRQGVVLSPHGQLFQCSIAAEPLGNALESSAHTLYFSPRGAALRAQLLSSACPRCVHDQSGAWAPTALAGVVLSRTAAGHIATVGMRAAGIAFRAVPALARAKFLAAFHRRPPATHRHGSTAIVIGAYGGEHVGDAAILGGVLLRLQRDFGITKAHVASLRPDRTRRWAACLDVPVEVDVFPYRRADIRRHLREADMLAYGGGPIMDLPDLLVRHTETANLAATLGKPFIAEGVGYGPFHYGPSRWTAQALVGLASAVSARSPEAAKALRACGQDPRIVRDPAFDYLDTRTTLGRVSDREARSITTLFDGCRGHARIGVNLRPFWHKYGGGSRTSVARHEAVFVNAFAEALTNAAREAPVQVTYFFFPMNADQYGFSDLAVAYRLRDAIAGRVNMRIWEIEPGVDAVLSVLRQLDAAVTMRFHAGIFALSQGIRTIGIDYQIGGTGKVGELFRDHGGSGALHVNGFEARQLTAWLAEGFHLRAEVVRANSGRP